jgi:DNA modification methylase
MTIDYIGFLRSKMVIAKKSGIAIDAVEISPALKPHQRDAVMWAVQGGRRAIFAAFGLGKTIMQLEWCRLIHEKKGGKMLIVCPLGVKQEFMRDAERLLGMDAPVYVRNMEEVEAAPGWLVITNYERVRDGDINPRAFAGTSLDEAAVLRSFGSKTYQTFLDKFRGVPYKLVSTATPSPNKYKELIHYAGYLEIMDTGQALTRFFKRDSTKANNLTLYPHKEKEFWLWLSTWALFIQKPSNLGYDDTGYDLPELEVRYHKLGRPAELTEEKDGQIKMFHDAAQGLKEAAREKRESIDTRMAEAKRIIDAAPDDHFIIWHDLEAERHAIKKALPEVREIYGSQDLDVRERNTMDFSDGKFRLLATKKELSGSGCNFQRHCHRMIFLGIDYEFNDFIQAIHRCHRFLQPHKVIVDIIYMDSEQEILKVLQHKWTQYNELTSKMAEIIKEYGLGGANAAQEMGRSIGVERVEIKGDGWTAINNDCIEETKRMAENSVDEIITSIPFSNHYEYTASYNDFGHNEDTARFFEQMDYLSPELLRILKPGRVFACHVKDRVLFGNATGTGMPTIEPFHALCIDHYMHHGFQYFGMITVVTDVVRENNQTYRLGWTEQCKDGSKMGVGCPEYILLFRKLPTDTSKAYADDPVTKTKEEYTRGRWQIDAHGFWRSSGDRPLTKEEVMSFPVTDLQRVYRKYSRESVYDYEEHVAMAERLDKDKKLPATFMVVAPGSWTDEVWDDINRMRTMNTLQAQKGKQLHVCPLQFDIVERLIDRYSNAGDLIFDPFGGLMTVPICAIKRGRRGMATELNADYFRDGVGYLKVEEAKRSAPTLFDFLEAGEEVEEGVS